MLIKHTEKRIKSKVKYSLLGQEVLRMFKYFPAELLDPSCSDSSVGCYITMIMLETGAIYTCRNPLKPTTTKLASFRKTKKWNFEGYREDSPRAVYLEFLQKKWTLPRNYPMDERTRRARIESQQFKKALKREQVEPLTKGPQLTKAMLAKIEERDRLALKSQEKDERRARAKASIRSFKSLEQLEAENPKPSLIQEVVDSIGMVIEPLVTPIEEVKKFKRPIPSMLESWFWNLEPNEQAALMKEWGYEVEFKG